VAVDAALPDTGAHERDPYYGLAGDVGRLLDRRRLCAGNARLALWAVALAIEYLSPAVRFWIPKYGATEVADWMVEGGHMAGALRGIHHHCAG